MIRATQCSNNLPDNSKAAFQAKEILDQSGAAWEPQSIDFDYEDEVVDMNELDNSVKVEVGKDATKFTNLTD